MARRKNKSKKSVIKDTCSMYPELHDNVCTLLEEDDLYFDFNSIDNDAGHMKRRVTNVVGRFNCSNKECSNNGWSSGVVSTVIRMYPGASYNARVYHQRCRQCETLSKPILDDSYEERVARAIKQWCGCAEYKTTIRKKILKGPHDEYNCEGCRANECTWKTREFD